jgi:hypothetical protein
MKVLNGNAFVEETSTKRLKEWHLVAYDLKNYGTKIT